MRILSLFIPLEILELNNRIIHSYLDLHVFLKKMWSWSYFEHFGRFLRIQQIWNDISSFLDVFHTADKM